MLVYLLILIIIVALINKLKYRTKTEGGGIKNVKKNNILIIDGANMYSQWYIKRFRQRMDFKITNQKTFIKFHTMMMDEHYNNFVARGNDKSIVHYVLKNPMIKEKLSDKMYDILKVWLKSHPQARISIALDYSWWKGPLTHTHKGRDDYLCFYLAQQYMNQGHKVAIMSNDKYKDYDYFNVIPEFTHVNIKPNSPPTMKKINPSTYKLGDLSKYRVERIYLKFTFKKLFNN
jgi:hypothetical protein